MNTGVSSLRVKGFRRLRDTQIDLHPFNVLIGTSGKTSVLETLRLLAASAEGRLQETISAASGAGSVITHGRDSLSVSVEMPIANLPPMLYDLQIQGDGHAYSICQENLRQYLSGTGQEPTIYIDSRGRDIRYYENDKLQKPNWRHQPYETSLFQVPKIFQAAERFRCALSSSTLYQVVDVSPRAPIRSPQPLHPARTPGLDGENLVPCLYSLREGDRDRFDAIVDALAAAFPSFERLDVPPAAAGLLSLAWKDRHYKQPFSSHQLSKGTLRFLWLVTLLQSPELPIVTMIDEPETSLPPEMLPILAELMREAAVRTQLIVATRSDRLVRFLQPKELVVCDSDDEGGARLTRGSDLDLERWLIDYRMDELWSLGRLGGRS
ncbi:MAG: AAA family ATPase [Candidatus Eremiobacteraeota bacterium]|nr:AAA family ATPase [Candidatus Eremiobacteraeota bacterium]